MAEVVVVAVLVLATLAIVAGAAVRYIVNDGGGPHRQPTRRPDSNWQTYAHR